MYPLKFEKVLKEKVWGGTQFDKLLNIKLPLNKHYGESWEVSTHKHGKSIVNNGVYKGQSLEELIFQFGAELLGEEVSNKFVTKFPLLVKYLDINDKLSVQVHPDDNYAMRVEGEFGKFESWYILEASNDAKLILGMADGVNKKQFESQIKEGNFSNLFREISVKKGDFIDITPGLVHASLTGSVVLCEIQQNSDTTYRIYDFDREFKGEKRELHVEKSLDVIDFNLVPNITTTKSREKEIIDGGYIERLTHNDYYTTDHIKLEKASAELESYKNFSIISVIEGDGTIKWDKEEIDVSIGDTYFIPANLKVTLDGEIDFLKSYI